MLREKTTLVSVSYTHLDVYKRQDNNIGELCDMPLQAMQQIDKRINQDAINLLSVEASVNSRVSYGGTAPKNVLEQVQKWKEKLANV